MIPGILGTALGLAVTAYGVLRPASDFAEDRRRRPADYGWPVAPLIARLPLPLARATWVAIGCMIVAGGVAMLAGR